MTDREQESMSYRVALRDESDVSAARGHVRELGRAQGLPVAAIEALATAVTEIARNILVHSQGGDIELGIFSDTARRGVVVIARDEGPGIADVDAALQDGYSTGSGLGLGLPSARRLVDEFELRSVVGVGTTVRLMKWSPIRGASQ